MNGGNGEVQITRVSPDTAFTPGAPPVPGYRVEFTSPSGVRSHVIVPRSPSLPDDVQQAVVEEVARIEAILSQTYRP